MIEEEFLNSFVEKPSHQEESVSLSVRYGTNPVVRYDQDTGTMVREEVKLRSYNGRLMGPLIERCPGDTLLVNLSNRLPPEPEAPPHEDPNVFHELNTTNLHVHGLHVSPAGNSDNILLRIGPGEHFHFEIKIPSDHPAGTYWYHSHKHGSTAVQVASGMAGPLIIRGDIDALPPIRAATERIFFFQELLYMRGIPDPENPGGTINGLELPGAEVPFVPGQAEALGLRVSVNGEFEPLFSMRPGDVQRWRFIHAGVHDPIKVRLVSAADPQRVIPQYQIAHDGITTGRLDRVEMTELHSGYRTDVLVHAVDDSGRPLRPGVYLLMNETNPALPPERRVLARIQVSGWSFRHKRLPTEDELRPLARPFIQVPESQIVEQRVEFSSVIGPGSVVFRINGKPFDPAAPPLPLRLGAVNRWVVTSLDTLPIDHSFHIHVNPFQVEKANGLPIWKDTLVVHPQETVRLLTRYERYVGVFPIHCHVLFHEDHGMMQLLEIKEGEPNHTGPHH